MARKVVVLCDFGPGSCQGNVTTFRLWREGERQAWSVDLCVEHAKPLELVIAEAEPSDLPTKPRVRMEPTKLRVTDRTKHLKVE